MIPPFAEALADLLAKYADTPIDDLITDMEIALDGLNDDARFEATGSRTLPQD